MTLTRRFKNAFFIIFGTTFLLVNYTNCSGGFASGSAFENLDLSSASLPTLGPPAGSAGPGPANPPTFTNNKIIPDDRIGNWTPGVSVGVPGGIPERDTICKTVVGSNNSTQTISGTTVAGSNQVSVSSVGDFKVGQGIRITGAAFVQWTTNPGADLHTVITAINGNVLTLEANADVSASNAAIAHNDAAAIQSAINSCPSAQVVFLPAGNYRLLSPIVSTFKNDFVVRGAGMGKTILYSDSVDSAAFNSGVGDWPVPAPNIPITSGATKNSTTITVADTSKFEVGEMMYIYAGANPSFVHNLTGSSNPSLQFTFVIKSLTANSITFFPALPMDLSAYSPKLAVANAYGAKGTMSFVGYEDFSIDMIHAPKQFAAFNWQQMHSSWIRNVEIMHSSFRQTYFYSVSNSEFRGMYVHDGLRQGPNTEGVDFASLASFNLIEDNIVDTAGGIVLNDAGISCSGNVIAYNVSINTGSGVSDIATMDIDLGHGPHPAFNLVEGNITGKIHADGYFGSASHDMIFRNWVTARNGVATNNLQAIRLQHYSDYFTVVGNILGTSSFASTNSFYDAPYTYNYDNGMNNGVQVIFQLGFPNIGNTGFSTNADGSPVFTSVKNLPDYSGDGFTLGEAQSIDLNVAATLLRHGNYDYAHKDIVWDPNIADKNIPASMMYGSTPSWWPQGMAWPAFDPAKPPSTSAIPAAARYLSLGKRFP